MKNTYPLPNQQPAEVSEKPQVKQKNSKLFVIIIVSVLLSAVVTGSVCYSWQRLGNKRITDNLEERIASLEKQVSGINKALTTQSNSLKDQASSKKSFENSVKLVTPKNSQWKVKFIGTKNTKTVDLNFGTTEMFNYGLSPTKRFASTTKVSDSNSNNLELLVYDYDANTFLTVDNKILQALKKWPKNIPMGIVRHYWSPTKDELFIHTSVTRTNDVGFFYRLKVNKDKKVVELDHSFKFRFGTPLGWTSDGETFAFMSIVDYKKGLGTSVIIPTKTSLKLIDASNNVQSIDDIQEKEKYVDTVFYKDGHDKKGRTINPYTYTDWPKK